MSTVKTDAITAVSAGGDLSLDGLGTGGVSIASTLKMTKGGDIASASPLVIDTDGNYFDVTGTTNFSVMTVEAGNFFMLQFDGALTITHGSGIELPGAANLTTATGDRLMCYATAANTVEVMSVETEAAAGAGSRTLISSTAVSGATNFTISGLTSGSYSCYEVFCRDMVVSTDSAEIRMQFGDGSLSTAAYHYVCAKDKSSSSSTQLLVEDNVDDIKLGDAVGNATGEGWNGHYFLWIGNGTQFSQVTGHACFIDADNVTHKMVVSGHLAESSFVMTQFNIATTGGNMAGQITVFGLGDV